MARAFSATRTGATPLIYGAWPVESSVVDQMVVSAMPLIALIAFGATLSAIIRRRRARRFAHYLADGQASSDRGASANGKHRRGQSSEVFN